MRSRDGGCEEEAGEFPERLRSPRVQAVHQAAGARRGQVLAPQTLEHLPREVGHLGEGGGEDGGSLCHQAASTYIPQLRDHVFSQVRAWSLLTGVQVVAGDMEAVAKAVLTGVEEALKDKRKELMRLREKESVTVVVDYRSFTREVNVVVR